ncbi:Exported zinc metalloprotease YfgC precursor [Candidatus Burkholderia verschuerenii]|uniref:Exported zinc metalloprotease YfgC n=1 Tax=Candidatus Burkholderia verschuerenii TaxID=242163 RepID=A0A0L0MGZ4_9BURK|nr:M48 family metalloprotease [Candidatus Burkholderia verschuerenii]KND61249.1 Exported zinc metalloprotease YfgC precursor [Candidatus Burkholderia verschuerenii]
MPPKRPSRSLIAVLCLSLAVPPTALAQTGASAPSAGVSTGIGMGTGTGTLAASALQSSHQKDGDDAVPGNVADGVFGVYGGRESRITNRPGALSGLRAPLASVQLPDLGDGSGGTLSPQAERKVGERLMRDVRSDPDYLDDWLIRDYLDSIAAKLSTAAAMQYLGGYRPDFDLFAVRDPQINAFSMPGGFIGVNTGLIATTQTESELASVIGHEMGHVLQRHIARMISAQEKNSYAALAAMLAGLLAGVMARSGDLGMGIAMGGQAFAVDNTLRFSRAAEHEADRVGFQMLTAAGYDPYAMAAFFERLDRSTMGDNGVPAYVRTHPLTTDRIADMEDRARRVPYRQPRQAVEYAFVRARARVLQVNYTSDYREVASRLKSEIADQTGLNPAANWYGIALAQSLIGDYDAANDALAKSRKLFEGEEASEAAAAAQVKSEQKAQQASAKSGCETQSKTEAASAESRASLQIAEASASNVAGSDARGTLTLGKPIAPDQPASSPIAASGVALPPIFVHAPNAAKPPPPSTQAPRSTPSLDVLAADIARRAGRYDDAIRLADIAQKRWPESHAAVDEHLQALIAAHRYADAQTLARRETRAEPGLRDWWLYLAQASAGLNDPLRQHQAMAEKLALDGAWPSAIRQLKEARDVKTASFYDLSTISARLREFESRYKEERDEEKNS